MNKRPITLFSLALLAGCTVGPDYKTPDLHLPSFWPSSVAAKPADDAKAEIQQDWWKNFNDPILNQLIDKAAQNNFDVKIAESRLAQARAERNLAGANLLPSGGVMGSDEREANQFAVPGGAASFPGIAKPFNVYETGFDASWELDVFGGKRRALESGVAEVGAAEATRNEVMVSTMAEIARNYIDIRQYQQQLKITRETIKSEEKTVSITSERYHSGNTSELDLTQARARMGQLKSQLPYYQNLQAQSEYALDVLLGEQPGATHALVEAEKPVPVSDKQATLAAPAAVIANRPDIHSAERELASATAQQGVATAQLFPDISLSGFFGLLSLDSGQLLKSASKSWMATGAVSIPLLNYGRIEANIDAADAKQKEALLTYQKSVVAALSDVAKSVTAYSKQEEFRADLAKTVTDNQKATDIAHERYRDGLSTFIDVLDAERTLYSSQSDLVQANAQSSQDLVAVYKSLGGGWKR